MKNMNQPLFPLFWLDMEMTGLDATTQQIIEIALIVTDIEFNILETFECVVFQNDDVLNNMDDWCKMHHGKTGLLAKIPFGTPLKEVEKSLLQIVEKYSPKEKAVLAGNSIHQDRKFVDRWMPDFSSKLHYRMCDVSSFKIIFEHKYKKKYKKQNQHRALADIQESIAELKFYLSFMKD